MLSNRDGLTSRCSSTTPPRQATWRRSFRQALPRRARPPRPQPTGRRSRTTRRCCGTPIACRWPNARRCWRSTPPSCTSRTGSLTALAQRPKRSRCAASSATTSRSSGRSSSCRATDGWPGSARARKQRSRRPSSSRNAAATRTRWRIVGTHRLALLVLDLLAAEALDAVPEAIAQGPRGLPERPARAVPQLPRLRAGAARRRRRAGGAAGEPRARAPRWATTSSPRAPTSTSRYWLWLLTRHDELDEILEEGLAFCRRPGSHRRTRSPRCRGPKSRVGALRGECLTRCTRRRHPGGSTVLDGSGARPARGRRRRLRARLTGVTRADPGRRHPGG